MSKSQNGWPASPDLKRRKLIVAGVEFVGGIVDNDDVSTVLGYVAEQFHQRVEPLRNPGCWGFFYRANRNDATSLSNHSSGTAIDVNAPKHPNGVATARTYSRSQVAEVHKILAEVDNVVRWGGDYTKTVDAMHLEINGSAAAVAKVAARLRAPPGRAFYHSDKRVDFGGGTLGRTRRRAPPSPRALGYEWIDCNGHAMHRTRRGLLSAAAGTTTSSRSTPTARRSASPGSAARSSSRWSGPCSAGDTTTSARR
jgi:hypothetical protein